MPENHRKKTFKQIDTEAVDSQRKTVKIERTYPEGASKAIYDAIDQEMVRVYGNTGTRTIGTFSER